MENQRFSSQVHYRAIFHSYVKFPEGNVSKLKRWPKRSGCFKLLKGIMLHFFVPEGHAHAYNHYNRWYVWDAKSGLFFQMCGLLNNDNDYFLHWMVEPRVRKSRCIFECFKFYPCIALQAEFSERPPQTTSETQQAAPAESREVPLSLPRIRKTYLYVSNQQSSKQIRAYKIARPMCEECPSGKFWLRETHVGGVIVEDKWLVLGTLEWHWHFVFFLFHCAYFGGDRRNMDEPIGVLATECFDFWIQVSQKSFCGLKCLF